MELVLSVIVWPLCAFSSHPYKTVRAIPVAKCLRKKVWHMYKQTVSLKFRRVSLYDTSH